MANSTEVLIEKGTTATSGAATDKTLLVLLRDGDGNYVAPDVVFILSGDASVKSVGATTASGTEVVFRWYRSGIEVVLRWHRSSIGGGY